MAEVALIVGGGPGISASCARLFASEGMRVAVACRNTNKPVLERLVVDHDVRLYRCDAAEPDDVATLFRDVAADLGTPKLVVHNIDGRVGDIFRKSVTDADPGLVLDTVRNSAFSAFLVAHHATAQMLAQPVPSDGHRGSLLFTNASAALKGYAQSAAFAMACQAKIRPCSEPGP